jgi:hypothetical protein
MSEVDSNRAEVSWSPRLPKAQLRRLYESVAAGLWDEDLIDEVGMVLLMRCRDILKIHRAQQARLVTCPRCERAGTETLIRRTGGRETPMTCPTCGWTLPWKAYHRSFQRRQLNPGGAVDFFAEYVRVFERAREPRAKVMAIDRLVHCFHYSCRQDPDRPTRPGAVNLLGGKLGDLVPFLDELSGLGLPPEMEGCHREWQERYRGTCWPGLLDAEGDS